MLIARELTALFTYASENINHRNLTNAITKEKKNLTSFHTQMGAFHLSNGHFQIALTTLVTGKGVH